MDTCRPAVGAVRSQLAEGRIGLAPSSVRQMMPGAQASATTVRATIAANNTGHHAPTLVTPDLSTMSVVSSLRLEVADDQFGTCFP